MKRVTIIGTKLTVKSSVWYVNPSKLNVLQIRKKECVYNNIDVFSIFPQKFQYGIYLQIKSDPWVITVREKELPRNLSNS